MTDRIENLEFKLAFLERELEAWKEVVDGLHARLERSEAELRRALRELRGDDAGSQSFAGEDSGSEASS